MAVASSSSTLRTTDYHAKYYAHVLTQRHSGDSPDKLASSLADALVDLNPHQIDAALFAFKSPLSKGALLADEVGLGKTIEAGLVISQFWAERKRRILILTPANLRKQWQSELAQKFHLPVKILDGPTFNQARRRNRRGNPFDRNPREIVLTSIPFAARKTDEISDPAVAWDLVVIDEAHHLRNPKAKRSRALKEALGGSKKLLLTATPLQNRLEELWGLATLIDPTFFGDREAFIARYQGKSDDETFRELRKRIRPLVQRTLRKDAREFVRYTNRESMVQEFIPTPDEHALYLEISEYLQRDDLMALPYAQRALPTMILRKLLASSTFAIAGALRTMARRLERELHQLRLEELDELGEDFESFEEHIEEWDEDEVNGSPLAATPAQKRRQIDLEARELHEYADKAERIRNNAKGGALIDALHRAFAEAQRKGAPRKALIFTESRKTQDYLYDLLSQDSAFANRIMLFNGSNSDPQSRRIYEAWREQHTGSDRVTGSTAADKRAALVDYFRDHAEIMIATEAAAEGINLQFCSLVINYDLPWNPQRIEQRIGRCHRYGQLHDVIVVNFVNKKNEADQRVYELLRDKFHLFSGLFGASDDVLGAIGSDINIERRIAEIYQNARTTEEINAEFDKIQREMSDIIEQQREVTASKLFENFDENVAERFRTREGEIQSSLDHIERALMGLARHELRDVARFSSDRHFVISAQPYRDVTVPMGRYDLPGTESRETEVLGHVFRPGSELSVAMLDHAKARHLHPAELVFHYDALPGKQSAVEPLIGSAGWIRVTRLSINMDAGSEDHLLLAGYADDGITLDRGQVETLLRIPGTIERSIQTTPDSRETLDRITHVSREDTVESLQSKIMIWFEEEQTKLDAWVEDRRLNLEGELDRVEAELRALNRDYRRAASMSEKLQIQSEKNRLARRRDDLSEQNREERQRIYREQDRLMHKVRDRFEQETIEEELFTIRWRLM